MQSDTVTVALDHISIWHDFRERVLLRRFMGERFLVVNEKSVRRPDLRSCLDVENDSIYIIFVGNIEAQSSIIPELSEVEVVRDLLIFDLSWILTLHISIS